MSTSQHTDAEGRTVTTTSSNARAVNRAAWGFLTWIFAVTSMIFSVFTGYVWWDIRRQLVEGLTSAAGPVNPEVFLTMLYPIATGTVAVAFGVVAIAVHRIGATDQVDI